jgi:hypothetical protein
MTGSAGAGGGRYRSMTYLAIGAQDSQKCCVAPFLKVKLTK